jgi:hypothetical protein
LGVFSDEKNNPFGVVGPKRKFHNQYVGYSRNFAANKNKTTYDSELSGQSDGIFA